MTKSDRPATVADGENHAAVSDRAETVLERLRTEPRAHAVAVGIAIAIGLLLSWLHWFGLVLGGGLIGLVSATLPRAALGAVGFGVLVLVVFALSLGGSLRPVLEMTPVVYLTVASAIGLPLFGSLLRGLV
ncbi:hypothetical protein [Natronorubrum halophilum]|uniref:hypothetical protein n=1 Tax=Natronorubrum halophilum TaxID=1702106 RepID=UPI001EE99D15|nr:hypothetical protein [Natronorubrum halophilum]